MIQRDVMGCDFVVRLGEERRGSALRLLQLTDMQVIDSMQRRTPDRLRIDEINAWNPKNFDAQLGDHIRSLAAQTRPDLIFITGDIIYGSFDDAGTTFRWFCRLMDSLCIPWAPVFGNHDNESRRGVAWQCARFEESEYCLFRRGSVSGNGNYSVGVAIGDELVRVIHMLDSNGCRGSEDPAVIREKGIYPDQLGQISETTRRISEETGRTVPAFAAFHIPISSFGDAELEKGYASEERRCYTIGVDVAAADGDFGCNREGHTFSPIEVDGGFTDYLAEQHIEAVFVGHYHMINTCITWRGIRWVYGLKTGQYDYHTPGALGGTLVTLEGGGFSVQHVPALVPARNFPGDARMFEGYFADSDAIKE